MPRDGKENKIDQIGNGNTKSTNTPTNPGYKVENLSLKNITKYNFNYKVISNSFRDIYEEVVTLKFKVNPNNKRLKLQAQVWAKKLISLQHLYLKDIVSNSRSDEWNQLLENTFIYSYYKCILYALNDNKVSERPTDTPVVHGHSLLYNVMLNPSTRFEYDKTFVEYVLDHSDADYSQIKKKYSEFDFINDHLIDNTRRFSLSNPKYERILRKLFVNLENDDPSMLTMERSSKVIMQTGKDLLPLFNSFYSEGSSDITSWYFSPSERFNLLQGTTLFGKAVFLETESNESVQRFFTLNTEDDELYLVQHEVTAIAGSKYSYPK